LHAFDASFHSRWKVGGFKERAQAQNEEWNNSELLKVARVDKLSPADSFVAGTIGLEGLTTLETRMFQKQDLQATGSGVLTLVNITGGGSSQISGTHTIVSQ
jgi:hypothetical protein